MRPRPKILFVSVALLSPVAPVGAEVPRHALDGAIERSVGYLLSRQLPDGAWRSEVYGCLRGGPALTPYVLSALFFLDPSEEGRAAFRRGVDYLLRDVPVPASSDAVPTGLRFPVYTAAMTSRVVVLEQRTARHREAQADWLDYLRSLQLTEQLGWRPGDLPYGGWSFALVAPRRQPPGLPTPPFVESNLSATLFGLAAMRSARVSSDDPAWEAASLFVKRCQNFPQPAGEPDPRFDDGGFFFLPGDPLQNKAGIAGTDADGRERYRSYGTMTADGLRALLVCGVPPDHPRARAARRWLELNFSASTNPGAFAADREVLRNATYYYWAWAVSHAFARLHVREISTSGGTVPWAEELAAELLGRQRADGSWSNPFTDAKEDDPLVATPWAAAALGVARAAMERREEGRRAMARDAAHLPP